MKGKTAYWAYLALFLFLHGFFLTAAVLPFYPALIFSILAGYWLFKKLPLFIASLGVKWNGLLFGMQALLLLFYTAAPSPLLAIPAVLFLGIEYIRLSLSNRLRDLELQAKHFDEERARVNETFRIVRSERHDFLKHISVLHFMLEKEENKEAKQYLDQMVESYKETNLSIKGEKGTVAGVLHQMYQRAQKAGIDIVYDLDVPISSLPIHDQQLVALLGNLLSNSIDACEEWQQIRTSKAQISLQFYKRSGLFLLICKNSCLPVPSDILDALYVSHGKTTKSGSHEGLGTKIISDTVKKHEGYLDFVYKEEEFTVKIKVPSIQQARTI